MSEEKETQKAEKTPKKIKIPEEIKAPDDEKGGYKDAGLPEPTRYNDWEVKGRCSDF